LKTLRVLRPGLFTTVQDTGRFGFLKYGVPISGAMDTFSLVAANLLVGNEPNEACLETTLVGPELVALKEIQISLTGGNSTPMINGGEISMWSTIRMRKDDVLTFGKMKEGCRTYLALRGGINVPMVLHSRSTYVRGGFGGIEGRQLRKEDEIEAKMSFPLKPSYFICEDQRPAFSNSLSVNVVLGPQADMFPEQELGAFLSNEYLITLAADRMGYRLEGQALKQKLYADLVSDALLPGTIQVPNDGKPILIMRDAQTTGGYAKIAVATTPDLDKLGQSKPYDMIKFRKIPLAEAHTKLLEYRGKISSLSRGLRRQA